MAARHAVHGPHRGPQAFRDQQFPLVEPRGDVEHAQLLHEFAVQLLLSGAQLVLHVPRVPVETVQQLRLRDPEGPADAQHRVPPPPRPRGEFAADGARRRPRPQPLPGRHAQGLDRTGSAARHRTPFRHP
ncbi:hypothetical protein ACFY9C_30465 [Streptomyces filamentosus]|uniref:hypothetical protein n=1 Tax=Streptomyces filamentosus TaxID=67294 RepID=UPI0036E48C37